MRRRRFLLVAVAALSGALLVGAAISSRAMATAPVVPEASDVQLHGSYGSMTVSWRPPATASFDHVTIWEVIDDGTPFVVYRGTGTSATFTGIDNSKDYLLHVVVFTKDGLLSAGTNVELSPDTFLFAPEDGLLVPAPPRLTWAAVPGARFYNVQLYQHGEKLFSSWPRVRHLQLRGAWRFGGHRRALHPGRIHWYVWPAFGTRADPQYGKPLGASAFIVPGSACKASLQSETC